MPGPWGKSLTVSATRFQAQMDYLAAAGYHPVTLEEVYLGLAQLHPLPSKPVALTFDDGYLDNFTVVFPILRSHHFVAIFFVMTGAVGKPGYVSWADLRVMHAAGMAIESHTVHHPDLTHVSDTRLAGELTQSREAIIRELSEIPVVLAYPFGDYNERVVAAVRAAGYLIAVTTKPGSLLNPQDTYLWPRIGIGSKESAAAFARVLVGSRPPG